MNTFYQHLLTAYNRSFPFVKLSRRRAKDKPWITSPLKASIKEKHRLYRRLLLNQTKANNTIYKVYENKPKTTLGQAEIHYYRNIFNDKKHNVQQMWKHLNYIPNTKRNKANQISIDELLINGETITNDTEFAN